MTSSLTAPLVTDTAAGTAELAGAARPRIFTRPVLALLLISLGALSNFYLLFPVVPMTAIRLGAGSTAAGMCAAALMLCTVLLEPVTPLLLRRLGVRPVFAGALVLLGVPALLPIVAPSVPSLLVSCALRGAGLGVVLVAETAVLASQLPAERRGEGLGLYGVVIGIPSLLFLPFGVGLAQLMGPAMVFLAGAAAALAPLAVVGMLPRRAAPALPSVTPVRLRLAELVRMAGTALPFAATTIAIGAVSAFLPIAVGAPQLSMAGLLVQSCATPLARWLAGRAAARIAARALMVPALLTSAAGIAALILVREPVAVLLGMAVFGIGFGVAQYASLSILLDAGGPAGYDRASAIWNLAYDGGMGVGSAGFGVLIALIGVAGGFATIALLIAGVALSVGLAGLASARIARARARIEP